MNNETFLQDTIEKLKNGEPIRRHSCGNLYADDQAVYSYGRHFPLIERARNGWILNGDRYSNTTTGHQRMTRGALEIIDPNAPKAVLPYSALAEMAKAKPSASAITDTRKITILDTKDDAFRDIEYTDPKTGERKTRTEHLLGGALIRVGRAYFISSTDPSAHWGRGYFLTQLRRPATTFDEALESMKPKGSNGDSKRQGEWYFTPLTDDERRALRAHFGTWKKADAAALRNAHLPRLRYQRNPHHFARRLLTIGRTIYVKGTIRHSDGGHRMLRVGQQWHKATPSNQGISVSVGIVD